jgi:Leucine-rich repeat (LRR) protein
LGYLSLTEHSLEEIPKQVFEPELAQKLRTLDLSDNKLTNVSPRVALLTELKSLKLDNNKFVAGTLSAVSKLEKLQKLSLNGNRMGLMPAPKGVSSAKAASPSVILPELPSSLKEINLASNVLSSIPRSIISNHLQRLEKVDLSNNQLASVDGIWVLSNLEELQLDSNLLSCMPESMGTLKKLKVLSLKDNKFTVRSTIFHSKNPQPLPKSLFSDTSLFDLNLHGNNMTNTQVNQFEGFQDFLDRRQKVKSKMVANLSVCGLH